MNELKTSGDRVSWLNAVADTIMDSRVKPLSIDVLCRVIPPFLVTARNDGHVTAAEVFGEDQRDNYRAGQRIIIEEMVGILREQGFVASDDDGLRWLKPLDGEWRVQLGKSNVAVRGQRERRINRDRHILGDRPEADSKTIEKRGLIGEGVARGFKVTVQGERGAISEEELMIHPYAFLVPPMTEREREAFRADIAENGVRMPLILYPDAADKNPRSDKPRRKVLDGRHRLYFASQLGKPVRVETFEGTDAEARKLVISLNFRRRHLTTAQQNLYAVILFGEEAKQEAAEAKLSGDGDHREKSPYGSTEQSGGKTVERIVAKAQAAGLTHVTEHGIRNIMPVLDAPETRARVEAGEFPSVGAAHRAATKEIGIPPAPRGMDGSTPVAAYNYVRQARSALETALSLILNDKSSKQSDGNIIARLDEVSDVLRKIREALAPSREGQP